MARYIDVELLKENFAKRLNQYDGVVIKIDDAAVSLGLAIGDTPTADVVEVVRCKDCKWQEQCCEFVAISATYKDLAFCSCGERR